MSDRYVLDTYAVVSYYSNVFDGSGQLSQYASSLIHNVIEQYNDDLRLIIPSIVFIELMKFCRTQEKNAEIYFEVYKKISENDLIMIHSIEPEILENIIILDGVLASHDMHDKIIVATGLMFECPIITRDSIITDYSYKTRKIEVIG